MLFDWKNIDAGKSAAVDFHKAFCPFASDESYKIFNGKGRFNLSEQFHTI